MGLKNITTGDTLCDEDFEVMLEPPTFPEPVISMAVEPKTKADREKMGEGLQRLAEEDPTFRCFTNEETGQLIIAGMGELHLEIIRDRLSASSRWAPTPARRRSPIARPSPKPAEGEGKFIRQSGGRGQYGHACITAGSRMSAAKASRSRTRSSAARFPRNTSRRSLTASRKPSRAACWRATRWWM